MLKRIAFFILVFPSFSFGALICTHKVKRGESITKIAYKYSTTPNVILKLNRKIKNPNLIRVGDIIYVPCKKMQIPNFCIYKLKRGETLYALSKRFNLSLRYLVKLNHYLNPSKIRVGTPIRVPCENLVEWKVKSKLKPYDCKGILYKRFRVKGRWFYNPTGDVCVVLKVANRLDVPVRKGTKIHATYPGVVIYSSDTINGLSSLIIIKHPENFYSVYAGEDFIWYVKEGTKVVRGSVLGYALRDTILYFEIRCGERSLNPKKYMVVEDKH